MMRVVPRHAWRDELDSFSRQHERWLVAVSTRGTDGRTQMMADDLPLEGISQATPHSTDVTVSLGRRDRHLTHEVRNVVAMTIDLAEGHLERAIILDSADSTRTIVSFRSPARPEEVDGIPHESRE
jgi:hypothetical protein